MPRENKCGVIQFKASKWIMAKNGNTVSKMEGAAVFPLVGFFCGKLFLDTFAFKTILIFGVKLACIFLGYCVVQCSVCSSTLVHEQ